MNRRMFFAAAIVVIATSATSAAEQVVSITPNPGQSPGSTATVTVNNRVPDASVGKLTGASLRICWDRPGKVYLGGVTPLLAAPASQALGGYRWMGTAASAKACATISNSSSVPMAWIDFAARWPSVASSDLAELMLVANDSRFSGTVGIWAEPIGQAPGLDFRTEPGAVQFLGTGVFFSGFESGE